MGYATKLVPIPLTEAKITFKSLQSGVYVYAETERKYNKETQHTTPVRKTIGKLEEGFIGKPVSDLKSVTMMYPNANYFSLVVNGAINVDQEEALPEDNQPNQEIQDIQRSNCLLLGPYVVIKHLFNTTGIQEILVSILGSDAGLFMDLVAYSIICETNVAQHYPAYCYKYPLFTDGMRIYSDSTISRFFRRITVDQSIDFQNAWNEKRDKSQEILLSYDSTNKNTKAGHIEKAEFSKAAKENEDVPIVNYAVAYDVTNYDPLFYENYPGSIPDVGQMEYTIERAKGYNYKNITFILDRGYFSEDNIHDIESAGYSFIIMAKGRSSLLTDALNKVRGKFERDRAFYNDKFHVYGISCQGKLYETDDRDRYFYIYYHDIDGAVERERTNKRIRKNREALDKLLNKPFKTKPSFKDYEQYFDVEFEPIPGKNNNTGRKKGEKRMRKEAKNPPPQYILRSYTEKTAAINEEYNTHGYFIIVSNKPMTADEAIKHYKGRDSSEKLFLTDKSFLGNSAYRVYTDESEDTKTFIEFIASIIRNRMFQMLNDAAAKNDSRLNRITVPLAIGELEKIEIIRSNGQLYQLDHAVSATQKMILQAFGLTEQSIKEELVNVNNVLSRE